jgi:hypothetical protein
MTWGFVAGAAGAIGGALIGADASRSASNTQADAAANSNALQKQIYDQNRADQMPWLEAGRGALDKLNALLADGSITSKFAGDITKEPGYAFAAKEGQRAIDNSASARGGIGGAALKAGARFAEGNATKYYNDAFNRYYTERQNMLDPLYRIAGFGTAANTANAVGGQNYANQVGGNNIGASNAAAANAINQGNIYGNAFNQLGALGQRQNWWGGSGGVNLGPGWTDNPASDPFYMGP